MPTAVGVMLRDTVLQVEAKVCDCDSLINIKACTDMTAKHNWQFGDLQQTCLVELLAPPSVYRAYYKHTQDNGKKKLSKWVMILFWNSCMKNRISNREVFTSTLSIIRYQKGSGRGLHVFMMTVDFVLTVRQTSSIAFCLTSATTNELKSQFFLLKNSSHYGHSVYCQSISDKSCSHFVFKNVENDHRLWMLGVFFTGDNHQPIQNYNKNDKRKPL